MTKQEKRKEDSSTFPSAFDPQGSYTGVSNDPREKPVQDADDL